MRFSRMRARGLFVTDLDGTLLSFETRELPPRSRDAMARASEEGVALAIATGRRRGSYRADKHRLEGLSYRVSLSNGAVLLSPDNDSPSAVHDFSWEGALKLAALDRPGVHGLIAIAAPGAEHEPDCYVLRPDGRVLAAPAPWDERTHRPVGLEEPTSRPLVHAALHVVSRELAEELEPEAHAIFAGAPVEVHSVRSPGGGGALLEIVTEGGKGRAVRDLARELGVPFERTAAIGDDMNDARLLDAAAHRFAVGGSVLAARRPDAREVRTAEEGAVADALEFFVASL